MVDITPQWESITTYLGAAYSLKQDDKLPDYILALTKGTLAYEQAIKAAWIDFKRNPTEANAKKFAEFLKTYSGKHWPEVVKAVLGVPELSPKQQKMLEEALGEHHDYILTSLLPDMLKAASADNLNAMDHRAIFLYAGALWSFGLLATVMFDGLDVRDLADLFLFAGPNDPATCTGERGCEQYAGKVFTVAQILAENIIPGRLRCVTNCRHMLLPIASPLNKPKVPKPAMDYGQWQSEFKHLAGQHNQLDHGRRGNLVETANSVSGIDTVGKLSNWLRRKNITDGKIAGFYHLPSHDFVFSESTMHMAALQELYPELQTRIEREDNSVRFFLTIGAGDVTGTEFDTAFSASLDTQREGLENVYRTMDALKQFGLSENTETKINISTQQNYSRIIPTILKHLPGRHDQKSHAPGGARRLSVPLRPFAVSEEYATQLDVKAANAYFEDVTVFDRRLEVGEEWTTEDITATSPKIGPDPGQAAVELQELMPDNLERSRWKRFVAEALSNDTGIPSDRVGILLRTWADTSNDENPRSLGLQMAASEEFGAPLSEWQERKIAKYEVKVLNGEEGPEIEDNFGVKATDVQRYKTAKEDGQKVLRAMYNRTQKEFKTAGIDGVTLYRGSTYIPKNYEDKRFKMEEVELAENAMESWSLSFGTARSFSDTNYESEEATGIVLQARVPRERILCTPKTGFGCLTEYEYIVLGSDVTDKATVVEAESW